MGRNPGRGATPLSGTVVAASTIAAPVRENIFRREGRAGALPHWELGKSFVGIDVARWRDARRLVLLLRYEWLGFRTSFEKFRIVGARGTSLC
jgi:hypothetical protein